MSSDLYDHPGLYEALFPVGAHLPYYLDLARRADGAVLELACGTGVLTVPIAASGVRITGLDASEPMLALARERATAANVSVEHLHGDMRSFDLGRQFGLIYIAHNSLLHLHSTDDLAAAFSAVRRHLAPGGFFAFDIFNPSVAILAKPAGQRFPSFKAETESFGALSVDVASDYDAATQVNRSTLYVSAPGKPDAWVLPLALRSIFPQELPMLLAAAGLQLRSRMGDVDQRPFHSSSRLQVCLAQAA